MNWWLVKVYDGLTQTTTTLSEYARDEEHIKELLEETGWLFVSARPDPNEEQE